MAKMQSYLDFMIMAFFFMIRDIFKPRNRILSEVDIKPGDSVLDFGCGPGSYILPLSSMVGESGNIYALDVHPLSIIRIRGLIRENYLKNVTVIQSDCKTGIETDKVDVVLLYDLLHDLDRRMDVLSELHKVLKNGGILSVSDHHLKEDIIKTLITGTGLFSFKQKGSCTYTFVKSVYK